MIGSFVAATAPAIRRTLLVRQDKYLGKTVFDDLNPWVRKPFYISAELAMLKLSVS